MTFFKSLMLASVASISLMACQAKTSAPVDFAHQASDLKPDENVVYGKLENGVRYAIMQNATPSKTAAIRMRFGTGSLNDVEGTQGIAHFLEHMAFNGSENMPEGEMTKTLERYGLAFGADTNAYTSFGETVYQLDLPEVSDEMFEVTLGIMRETASNLLLDQDAIDRERGVVQSEKRNRDSPGYRAQMANLEFFLGKSRIMTNLPIGNDESLAAINKPDFESYYNGRYRPEDTFIVVVGDVQPDFVATKIDKYFSDWTGVGEALPDLEAGDASLPSYSIGYFYDPEIRTNLEIGVARPYNPKPDNADTRRQGLIDSLGNAILNRRLSTIALSGNAPFVSAGAGTNGVYETMESTALNMSTDSSSWRDALALGEQEIRRAVKYGFGQAELDEQIANLRKSLKVGAQTASTRRTRSLANAITGSFNAERVFTTPDSAVERFEANVDGITVDAVWESFKTQWEGIDEPLIWLQNNEEIDDAQAVIKAAYEASKAVEVEPPAINEVAKFAYTDFGAAGKIVSKDVLEETGITRIKFANNVMLNFKKTDFEKDSISIRASFGGGTLSLPKDNPHVQQLAGYAVMAGGLEAHSADELSRIMAGKTVGAGFGAGTERFTLSGGTVPDNLADQLNYMAAYFVAPGFRADAEPRYDTYIEGWYPTLDSTPGGVAQRDIGRLVRSGDVRFGIPSQSEIIAPTMSDVKAWVEPAFKKGQLEIAVVGDFDEQALIDEVARTFGALSARADSTPDYADQRVLKFPAATRQPITLSHQGEANRAVARIYWPAPDGTDITRDRRMNMLERVFSLRVLDVIREQEGAAYSPSAFRYNADAFPDYGYFAVSLDVKPEDVDGLFTIIAGIADEFKAGNFTQDEFDRAKKPALEAMETSLENNGYWMSLADSAQTDDDYKHFSTRETMYRNMTLEDIKPLAAEIFDNAKAWKVQILPEE